MTSGPTERPSTAPASDPAAPVRKSPPAARQPIASETLFSGAREVQIAHRGVVYRLKQTALGKLILTK
jgi:hemin uptake protein HemP